MYLYVRTYAHVLVSMETNEIFARRSFIITLAHRYYLFWLIENLFTYL